MLLRPANARSLAEAWLALGRAALLPTVVSNALAAWWLAGAGSAWSLVLLVLGTCSLFAGGAFLNDAFDADSDRLHRRERPIPSGDVGIDTVWRWGFGALALGTVLLVMLGNDTGTLAALLLVAILLHNTLHRLTTLGPLLMALCRFLLYLAAASAGRRGAGGLAVWCGLALACYVAGIGYLHRHGQSRAKPPLWPVWLLAIPAVFVVMANAGPARLGAVLLSMVFALWVLRSLQPTFLTSEPQLGRSMPDLRAGIVLVDLLALGAGAFGPSLALLGLFAAALLLHRLLPSD